MVTLDNKGFIWAVTNKGIAMFNGEKFKTYTTQDGLPVNDLWKIYADKQGRIWFFGRSSKLGYIENAKVYTFPSDNDMVINPTAFNITEKEIGIIGSSGGYWLEGGKWKFYGIGKRIYEFITTEPMTKGFNYYVDVKNNNLFKIGGDIVVNLDTNLNVKFQGKINGPLMQTQFSSPTMLVIDNNFFYCILNDRLISADLKKKEVKTIFLDRYFTPELMDEMYMYFAGNKVVMNGPMGRYVLDGDSLQLSIAPLENCNFKSSGFFEDSLNNTWISTSNDGLYMYPLYNKMKRFFMGENIQYVEEYKGKIYAAVENNGLFALEHEDLERINTKGKYFYNLSSSGDSILQFITNKEIGLFNLHQVSSPQFEGKFYNVLLKKFYDVLLGNFKAFYVDSGISYLATGTYFMTSKNGLNSIYANMGIYHMAKYRNVLVLGSTTGVKIFTGDTIKQIPVHITTQINKLTVLGNYLLIATEGEGLYSYNRKLETVPGTESFFVNNIRKMNDSVVWISTTLGAHEVKLVDGGFTIARSVLKSNGLPSNFVNDVLIKNDSMFCATNNGLSILNMKDLKLKADPDIVFSSIVANDSSFDQSSPVDIINRGNNNISINFDISYLHEHRQLRNYYKLEPVDKGWTRMESNTLVLNGLKPGKYRVKIRSIGFNQNTNERSVDIYIRPRWYETTIFWVVTIGCMFIFIFLIVWYFIRNAVKKRDRKHQLETKMVNLELDALRSKLNPHFIFNTFNAIQLFINNNQMDLSEKYLILLSKHIRNVFEFSHLQNITLDKEITLLKDYLEIEKIRFGDKINSKIEIDPRIDIQHTVIPSMMIQPFVENTMVHGLFHKKGVGMLNVKFNFINTSCFQVQIIDDGVGFVEKVSEKISSTKVIRERVALINQGSEFNVQIKKSFLDETREDKGTIITITIRHGK